MIEADSVRSAARSVDDSVRSTERFVEEYIALWRNPSLEGMAALVTADIEIKQPLSPDMHGRDEVLEEYRKLFKWIPGLHAEVEKWAANGDDLYIRKRVIAPLPGGEIRFAVIDEFHLRDGYADRCTTYFDSMPIYGKLALKPGSWLPWVRSRLG